MGAARVLREGSLATMGTCGATVQHHALRRTSRLELRRRQTGYDRAGCAALWRHLRAGLRVLPGTCHSARSWTVRFRYRSRVARQFGTRPVRADLECVARRALNAGLRTATRSA